MNTQELIKAVQSNETITFVDAKKHWKELAPLLEKAFPDLRWASGSEIIEEAGYYDHYMIGNGELCSSTTAHNKRIHATEAIKMLSINPDVTQEELRTMAEIMTPYGVKKIGRVGNGIVHEETGWYIRIIHEILPNDDVIAVCGDQVNKYLSGVKADLTHWRYHTLNSPQSKAQKELEELEQKHREMGEAIEKLRKEVEK